MITTINADEFAIEGIADGTMPLSINSTSIIVNRSSVAGDNVDIVITLNCDALVGNSTPRSLPAGKDYSVYRFGDEAYSSGQIDVQTSISGPTTNLQFTDSGAVTLFKKGRLGGQ